MKHLGKALRQPSTEPVNEVVRGLGELWKLPYQAYHISCRGGRPRLNWTMETATQAWDKFKLWKKIGDDVYISIDFDYRQRVAYRPLKIKPSQPITESTHEQLDYIMARDNDNLNFKDCTTDTVEYMTLTTTQL